MKVARIIMAVIFGGCWGYAVMEFLMKEDWGMVALTIGLLMATMYLAFWIVETK